ncbi:MAG: hypothetical protein IT423_14285 [Pirellulaceae bacterium]|nr:hypothetical protein [Pirellulaceae bacterium]
MLSKAILLGVLVLGCSTVTWAAEPLKAGMAETDITPPNGFPIAGYYHERLAEGTIDPLKAKALVWQQGDVLAAIVVCDLTAISRDLCEAVRRQASAQTGIPANAIAIAATHSHTAPDYGKHLYEYLKSTSSKESNPTNTEKTNTAKPYAETLISGIVQAIVAAKSKLESVQISAGSAEQKVPVSFNRRFVMRDGSVQTWRNFSDPQVVRAACPIDPEVSVVSVFAHEDSKPSSDQDAKKATALRGVLSSFALHLDTVGGMRWSADYPYFIEKSLREQSHPAAISIFGTGCCGDINHANPNSRERNKTEFIGNALAETLHMALASSQQLDTPQLQVGSTTVQLPLQEVTLEHYQRSTELLTLIKNGGKVEFLEQVAAYKTVMLAQLRGVGDKSVASKQLSWGLSHTWAGVGPTLPVDVQTITLGKEVALVFLPGEVFVDLGLAIKRGSPYPHTLVIELSNCVETAYIPTHAAAAGGSYEVTNSTVQPGAGEMLVKAALVLLRESASRTALANKHEADDFTHKVITEQHSRRSLRDRNEIN